MKFLTLLFLLLYSCAFAQEKAPLYFKVYSLGTISKPLAFGPVDKSTELEFSKRKRSKFYQTPKGKKIVFYEKGAPTNDEGKLNIVGSATIPNTVKEPLLVFVPLEKKEDQPQKYDIVTVDDNPKNFSPGKSNFINLTKNKVALVVGKKDPKTIHIKPKNCQTYSLSKNHQGNLPFKLFINENKKANLAMNSYLFPSHTTRNIYFIWPKNTPHKNGNLVKLELLGQNEAQMKQDRLNLKNMQVQ
ncbi:hypothetical protein [Persicirhabdus sediminis]|uniref:Uncharacterized protein n=1 Tax=Persicirhabdus sediminis TaxID=454144 RepID=A0A8J7MAY5_9BACT|nr:hypothetical protein [Persicirhabdus sediminis]MBK1789777.1 hypothetical protein [Persicirhabdus sediminis]